MADYIESSLYGGKVKTKFYPGSHQYWVSLDGGKKYARVSGATTILGIKDKSTPLGIWQQQVTADFLLELIAKKQPITIDLALEAVVQNDVKREEAADIGKEIHAYCEAQIKFELGLTKEIPEMPNFPEAITGVNSFLEWREAHDVKFISTERQVYSKKHHFMGTLDFEAKVDGKLCLGDFKSSNGLYNSVRMQTAAYAEADMEECGTRKYKGRWAIRLSKHSEAEYMKKELRKKEIKQAIARISGKEYKDYPIKPYQVFEAVYLDLDKRALEKDFEAFLSCKDLNDWNKATDSYLIKADNIESTDYDKFEA